jgi:hypothetical protein
MALQRQRQLITCDAAAIIDDANAPQPATFDFHPNSAGTGIQTVLDEFFDHRGRTCHHLTGCDLIDELG